MLGIDFFVLSPTNENTLFKLLSNSKSKNSGEAISRGEMIFCSSGEIEKKSRHNRRRKTDTD
jgi:hypothetical protein